MTHLNYLHDKLEEFRSEITELPYSDDDIRKSFFGLLWSVLDHYYKDFCWIYLTDLANKSKVLFDEEATDGFKKHLIKLRQTTQHEILFYGARNRANRSLITESWLSFEFCITYLCEELFNEDLKEELKAFESEEILKIIAAYSPSEQTTTKIKKKFYRGHLTHVPINRKYEKLYSSYKAEHSGDTKLDKEFLLFFGKYRNSLHTNYIYHGKDYTFSQNGVDYIFVDGEPIRHNKELDITHHFDLALELKNVALRLFNAIKTEKQLNYPLKD